MADILRLSNCAACSWVQAGLFGRARSQACPGALVSVIRIDYVNMITLACWILFPTVQDTDRTWTLRQPLRSWRRRAERARAQVVGRRRRRLLLSSLPLPLEPRNTGSTTHNPTCLPVYRPIFLNLNALLMRESSLLSSTVSNQRYASVMDLRDILSQASC